MQYTHLYRINGKHKVIRKINLKEKTGNNYAGIDTFKDNYLLVTYNEHIQLLVLDHTQPSLQSLFNISPYIQPFEYEMSVCDCCVVSEESNQLFIADAKKRRVQVCDLSKLESSQNIHSHWIYTEESKGILIIPIIIVMIITSTLLILFWLLLLMVRL